MSGICATRCSKTRAELHPLFLGAAGMAAVATRRDLSPLPRCASTRRARKEPEALKAAIRALDAKARIPALQDVPPALQEMAAMLLMAEADAHGVAGIGTARKFRGRSGRNCTRSCWSPWRKAPRTAARSDQSPGALGAYYARMELLQSIDLRLLAAGADDLTAVVDSARQFLLPRHDGRTVSTLSAATKLRSDRLSAGSDDEYSAASRTCW